MNTLSKNQTIARLSAEVDRLKKERDRLRGVLSDLLDCCIPTGHDTRTDRAMESARAILAETEARP